MCTKVAAESGAKANEIHCAKEFPIQKWKTILRNSISLAIDNNNKGGSGEYLTTEICGRDKQKLDENIFKDVEFFLSRTEIVIADAKADAELHVDANINATYAKKSFT